MKKVIIISAAILAVIGLVFLCVFLFSAKENEWRDYYGDDAVYDIELTREIEDFPGTEFVWTSTSVGIKIPNGANTFLYGFPIWNVFFYDITGDGYDDIFATVSVEEDGVESERIIIHDYQLNRGYEVSDPGNFNFRVREKNGKIIAIKTNTADKNDSIEGKIVYDGVMMKFEETK